MDVLGIQGIMGMVAKWLPVVAGIISVASLIAAITPSKNDDRIVQFVLDIVNKLGLNVGKATNKDA